MSQARWIFLRAYLFVALLVIVVGMGLEVLLEQRHVQTQEKRESTLLLGSFLYADQLSIPTESSARAALENHLTETLKLPAHVYSLTDFEQLDEQFELLKSGATLPLFNDDDQTVFYRQLAEKDWVLALGPAPTLRNDRRNWVVPLFYGLIAVAVFIWIRPLMRDLDILQRSATAFGNQDFTTRVTIPSSSWLEPLGEAFNSMAVRIQWLIQSHRELTHAVSHELRTPLARLRFSLEMLGKEEDPNAARHKDSMNRDIEELNVLIDEMLSYAELDQEHLLAKLEPLEITSWLYAYANKYNEANHAIPITLSLNGSSGIVLADGRLLSRALDNLIANAQRYANCSIELKLTTADEHCIVRVADDGPGIPKDKRAAALSSFTRLESAQGIVSHGFGLGLAIVKRVMDLHAGEVIIRSSEQGGAEIALRWPI